MDNSAQQAASPLPEASSSRARAQPHPDQQGFFLGSLAQGRAGSLVPSGSPSAAPSPGPALPPQLRRVYKLSGGHVSFEQKQRQSPFPR